MESVRFSLVKQISFFNEQYATIRLDVTNFYLYSELIEKDFTTMSNSIGIVRVQIQDRLDPKHTKQQEIALDESLQDTTHSDTKIDTIEEEILNRRQKSFNVVQIRDRVRARKQLLLDQLAHASVIRQLTHERARVLSMKLDHMQELVRFRTSQNHLDTHSGFSQNG
jgi:hypothetical protein